jgi:hypothetical protein
VAEEESPTRSLKEEAASRVGFGRLGDVACSERREGNGVKFRMVLRLSTWRVIGFSRIPFFYRTQDLIDRLFFFSCDDRPCFWW